MVQSQRASGPQRSKQRAPRGMVCVHCRQNKFRCDSNVSFPDPCSRCSSSGKRCSVDAGFRRTKRRGRIEQLEDELAQIRYSQAANDDMNHRELPQAYRIRNSPTAQSIAASQHPSQGSRHASVNGSPRGCQTAQASSLYYLEQVCIMRSEFDELLDLFVLHYHPQMPFLGSKSDLKSDARRDRLLLWAIVNAATRSSDKLYDLRRDLAWPIRRLAVSSAITSLPTLTLIQGLLLLCLWTPTYTSQEDDPSWTFCGIATHKAMQIGLHRTGFDHEYLRDSDFSDGHREARRRTWLMCFIVNERLSTRLGVPPTVSLNNSIITAISDESRALETPQALRDYLKISQKNHMIAQLLGNNTSSPDGLHTDPEPIVEAFDKDLTAMECSHAWSPTLRAFLYETKTRLYLYALNSKVVFLGGSALRSHFSTMAYEAATETISILRGSCRINPTGSPERAGKDSHIEGPAIYWVDYVFGSLVMASCTLLFLSQVSQDNKAGHADMRSPTDAKFQNTFSERARSMLSDVKDASRILRSLSIIEYDFFHRVSDVLAYMTQECSLAGANEPLMFPRVRSRMSANSVSQILKQAQKRWRKDGWTRGALQLPDPLSSYHSRRSRGSLQEEQAPHEPPQSQNGTQVDSNTGVGDETGTEQYTYAGGSNERLFPIDDIQTQDNVDFSCLLNDLFLWPGMDSLASAEYGNP